MGDDDGEATGSASERTPIADLGLDVADDGTLRHLLQRQHITDIQRRLLPAVDELSRVHPLGRDHQLRIALETVRVQELDLGHGSAAAGIVEDFLDDAADVASAFGVVDRTELDGTLASSGVRLEDGRLTLSLCLLISSYHI